jgi:hypothetical protein
MGLMIMMKTRNDTFFCQKNQLVLIKLSVQTTET